jgi:hypothetical protein
VFVEVRCTDCGENWEYQRQADPADPLPPDVG